VDGILRRGLVLFIAKEAIAMVLQQKLEKTPSMLFLLD